MVILTKSQPSAAFLEISILLPQGPITVRNEHHSENSSQNGFKAEGTNRHVARGHSHGLEIRGVWGVVQQGVSHLPFSTSPAPIKSSEGI